MRILIMSAVAFISYLIQSTFLEYIAVYDIKPNLIIITTISYALIRGKEEGAVYGLFSGLLLDIMAGKIIGIYALLGLYLGLITGILNKNLNNENYLNTIFVTAIGTFAYDMILYLLVISSEISSNFVTLIVSVIIPEIVYNSLFSIIGYFTIIYINKKIDYRNRGVKIYKY